MPAKNTPPSEEETFTRRKPIKRITIGDTSITIQRVAGAFMVTTNHWDGRRSRKRCATQQIAETVLKLRAIEAERVGVEAASVIKDADRVAILDFYKRTAKWPSKPSVAEALSNFIARHERQAAPLTFNEALESRLTEALNRGTTRRHLINVRSRLRTFVEAFGESTLDDISQEQIAAFIDGMPVSARSRADTLNSVASVFAAAVRLGKLPHNPAALVRPPKMDAPETEVISAQQLKALLSSLHPRSVAVVAVMAFSALRRSEAEALEWGNVQLEERVLVVTAATSKTAARRTVPISDTLHAWLATRVRKEGLVAPPAMTLRRDLEAARMEAGIEAWPRNALRHTMASVWVSTVEDVGRCAAWLGHDPRILHRHYKSLVSSADARAWLEVLP